MKLVAPAVLAAAAAAATLASAAFVFTQHKLKQQQQQTYAELMTGLAQPQLYRDAPIVIVVDVGSSSIRASCFAMLRRDGHVVEWVLLNGSLQQVHSDCIDANGEADILQIAAKVEGVVDGALRFLRATLLTSKIVGVGFSTFAMNILGINEKVCLYGNDTDHVCYILIRMPVSLCMLLLLLRRANRSRQYTRYGSVLVWLRYSGLRAAQITHCHYCIAYWMTMIVRWPPSVDCFARAKASRVAYHPRLTRRVP